MRGAGSRYRRAFCPCSRQRSGGGCIDAHGRGPQAAKRGREHALGKRWGNSMGDNLYALEKLAEAVHELATNAGRVQERLAAAWLYLFRIAPDDVPEGELRSLFLAIKDDLAFEQPAGDEGRLIATLRGMSDDDASDIAVRIWRLHHELRERLGRLRD
jgi:hypothetical protein